jgi:hypothetical protein
VRGPVKVSLRWRAMKSKAIRLNAPSPEYPLQTLAKLVLD